MSFFWVSLGFPRVCFRAGPHQILGSKLSLAKDVLLSSNHQNFKEKLKIYCLKNKYFPLFFLASVSLKHTTSSSKWWFRKQKHTTFKIRLNTFILIKLTVGGWVE